MLNRRHLLTAGAMGGAAGVLPLGTEAQTRGGGLVPFEPAPLPPPYPAKEFRIPVAEGVSLWGWDTGGSGETVVLLHPRSGSGHCWDYQREAFAKAGYRVIGYSRRGFFGSDIGPKDKPGTAADDLLAILAALKVERFHVIGSAAGASTAADLGLSHGGRVLSVTLACGMMGLTEGQIGVMDKRLRPPFFDKLPLDFQELGPSYRAAHPEGHARWLELHDQAVLPGQVAQGRLNEITLAALGRLKPRTLVISGECDLIAPPPVMAVFAGSIPGSRLEIISQAGHSAYWEQPRQFNEVVLGFLREGRRG